VRLGGRDSDTDTDAHSHPNSDTDADPRSDADAQSDADSPDDQRHADAGEWHRGDFRSTHRPVPAARHQRAAVHTDHAGDSAGHFEFDTVPDGSYLVFYNSGWDDFNAGVTKWTGKTIQVGDVQWLIDNYFTTNPTGGVDVMFPPGAKLDLNLGLYRFFGEGPFFWAHTCAADNCNSDAAVLPVRYDVTSTTPMDRTFPVYYHAVG
jgi:hypothetical protein